ncbi:hypothetical protein MPSYJ_55350 [Mycolicibacterium psychrotolerans]|uniref:Uncharacterized protein n=1 Tax=Mycolicibacterium psychrotolerans TaxID=216929 RepID=A0A7I7MIA2_9MYCO|nr:hypothetical protein MPSYJ_55350 [Mycolicibacterium psychrotolerans]
MDDLEVAVSAEEVVLHPRKVGIEAKEEFARCVEPLPRQTCDKPQQHWLFLEEIDQSARLHPQDEVTIGRGRVDEAVVQGGGAQGAEPVQKKPGQVLARRGRESAAYGSIHRMPKPCGSGSGEGRQDVPERIPSNPYERR